MKSSKSSKKGFSEKNPSIQNYFKTAGTKSSGRTIDDVRSTYVKKLKEKMKSLDEDENKEVISNKKTPQENDTGANETDAGINDLVTQKEQPPLATSGRNDEPKPIGCEGCDLWRRKFDETEDWRRKFEETEDWRKKYEEMRNTYIKLCVRHTNQVMKYDELLESVTCGPKSNIQLATNDDLPQTAKSSVQSDDTELSGQVPAPAMSGNVFSENEIRTLQSLPLDKKKDSTFILQCIEYAYKDRTASLVHRSLKGTQDRIEIHDDVPTVVRSGKDPLTPEKVQQIERLFVQRISKSKCLPTEFGARVKQTYINRLIGNAVKNVSNKEQPARKKIGQNNLNL